MWVCGFVGLSCLGSVTLQGRFKGETRGRRESNAGGDNDAKHLGVLVHFDPEQSCSACVSSEGPVCRLSSAFLSSGGPFQVLCQKTEINLAVNPLISPLGGHFFLVGSPGQPSHSASGGFVHLFSLRFFFFLCGGGGGGGTLGIQLCRFFEATGSAGAMLAAVRRQMESLEEKEGVEKLRS